MKWKKETQAYMWAHYYSEDGKWKAWDENIVIKGGGRKKFYNPKTQKMEHEDAWAHVWYLKNLETNEVWQFKTLRESKEFAEVKSFVEA